MTPLAEAHAGSASICCPPARRKHRRGGQGHGDGPQFRDSAYSSAYIIYRIAGKPAEAIPMKAIRLGAFTPGTYYANLGMAFFQNGTDCEEAVKACEKALDRRGDDDTVWATTVFSACGREKEARKTAKGLLRINPKFSVEAYTKRSRNTRRTRTGLPKLFARRDFGETWGHDCSGRSGARRTRGNPRRG